MAIKFYNPGSKLYEKMAFDHPTNDVKVVNLIAYFQIDAAEKSFFDVPTEVDVDGENGTSTISVRFADRLQHDYKDYGLIRIDPRRREINEDDNVAADEKSAKVKGDRMWRDYLVAKSYEHVENVDRATAAGLTPKRATGVYAHALKVLGIEDPADKVGNVIRSRENVTEMSAMQAQMAEMARMIQTLTEAQPVGKGR